MKKIFTFLFILSAFYFTASAQTANTFEFGASAGVSTSNIIDNNYGDGSNFGDRVGFTASVQGEYYFSDRWSFKAKATYDQKGWNNGYVTFDDGSTQNANFQLNYVTVPLLASWHFTRERNWYLHFGPYAGFLLNAKESITDTDVKDAISSTDFGLAFGVGVSFRIADNTKFFVETDGQAGFANIFKDSSNGTAQNIRSSLNAGITFSFGQ